MQYLARQDDWRAQVEKASVEIQGFFSVFFISSFGRLGSPPTVTLWPGRRFIRNSSKKLRATVCCDAFYLQSDYRVG
jgi:hypothetical protein